MKRDEQLLHATTAYQAKLLEQGYNPVAADNYADGFYEGAVWADANPQWHKCGEELPEPNVPVLAVANADTVQFVGYYDDDEECWRDDLNDEEILASIDYWTELPQPPKFD